MKKRFFVLGIFTLIFLSIFSLVNAETISCNPTINLVSQDPNPSVPNDYVKLLFEISNFGDCNGLAVQLNPEYPFSLDSNESSIQSIETNPYVSGYKSAWAIAYKLRIDSDAFDGDYSLFMRYHGGNSLDFSSYLEQDFNISIKDSRTEFDAVIQEASSSEVSIAIANVGKYAANSVIVKIPEQDDFSVSGTDGQMVGNLESGDYTIVGFSITRKIGGFSKDSSKSSLGSNKLQVDVHYTDNIGERRVVNMNLTLNLAGNSSVGGIGVGGFNTKSSTNFDWLKWIIIISFVIIGYVLYKKYPSKLTDLLKRFKSDKKENLSSRETPNWVKVAKEKEKKK